MFMDLSELESDSKTWRRLKRAVHRGVILFLVSVALIAQVGCVSENLPSATGEGSGSVTPAEEASLTIRLTDAPFPFASIARADVRITSVLAHIQGPGVNRWVQVSTQELRANLLDLRGGISALLAETKVPAGTIRQLRLIIAEASVTLKDGRFFPLKMPSADASGLKLFLEPPLEVKGNEPASLMLDFDVSRSFVVQGNPETAAGIKGILFKPVVRVGNNQVHGNISGEIFSDNCTPLDANDDLPLDGASVFAQGLDEHAAMAGTGADGKFIIFGLEPATYAVRAEAFGFASSDSSDVSVAVSQESYAGRITLAKKCNVADDGSDDGSDDGGDGGSDGSDGTDEGSDDGSNDGGDGSDETDEGTDEGSDDGSGGGGSDGGSDGGEDSQEQIWSVIGFDATAQAQAMQIFWQSQVPTTGIIRMGLSAEDLSYREIIVSGANTSHVIFIEDLEPETNYYLQVLAKDALGVERTSAIILKATKAP